MERSEFASAAVICGLEPIAKTTRDNAIPDHLVVADIEIEDQESHQYTTTGIPNGLVTGKCRSLRPNPHWCLTVQDFEWNVPKNRRPASGMRFAVINQLTRALLISMNRDQSPSQSYCLMRSSLALLWS